MIQRLLPTIALVVLGFSLGWFSREWIITNADIDTPIAENNPSTSPKFNTQEQVQDNHRFVVQSSAINKNPPLKEPAVKASPSLLAQFQTLLNTYRYEEAVALYQTQEQNNRKNVALLKQALLVHLENLLAQQQFNDFSALVDSFLSSYYDDIDVLLLLASFNRINGLHIEAINIYQLADTYAYQHSQQEALWSHFDSFVKNTDSFYTAKEDWYFLNNFYSQIEISGLITPQYQYRQAVVNLRSGDELLAIEQLQALENDTVVGKQARSTLQQLMGDTKNRQKTRWQSEQSIALQQQGNQYLVDLGLNNQDKVTLLIDTGASMTTLSQATFMTLNSKNDAVKIGERVFNTANGVTKGIIYRFPQLKIGPYQISNIPIAVLNFSMGDSADGLLGMNTLGQFRFQIDQENQTLLLSRKDNTN